MELIKELAAKFANNNLARETVDKQLVLLRQEGRKDGELAEAIKAEAHAAGKGWPTVIEDERTNTTTVPATFEGILAFLCSWDSKLLDEELLAVRALTTQMVPLGLKYQKIERQRRAKIKEEWDHIKEEHPEAWDKMQGYKV